MKQINKLRSRNVREVRKRRRIFDMGRPFRSMVLGVRRWGIVVVWKEVVEGRVRGMMRGRLRVIRRRERGRGMRSGLKEY